MQIENILFPTDFSACAQNALNFVVNIAEAFYSTITLVHVVCPSTVQDSRKEKLERLRSARAKLDDLKLEVLQKNASIKINTIVREGRGAEPLSSILEQEMMDLVVAGTSGMDANGDTLLGSFASSLVDLSRCPVLTVPSKARFNGFQKIVYASDMDHIDVASIKVLTDIARLFNSEVSILNISGKEKRFSEEQLFEFERLVRETASYPKLDFIYFYGNELNRHIQEYTYRNKIDLLVMTRIKHSQVGKLLYSRNTQRLGYHNLIPLMAFHESDKCCQKITSTS